ncbi:MAG: hypothetical protein P8Z31_12600 [Gammaproteobacteria bacterium]|jgi:hypothetical protein
MTAHPARLLIPALLPLLLLLPGYAPASDSGFASRQEAAAEARRRVDGRILSIKLEGNPPEYRVKVLKGGDVHLLRLPAKRNGRGKGQPDARPRR